VYILTLCEDMLKAFTKYPENRVTVAYSMLFKH